MLPEMKLFGCAVQSYYLFAALAGSAGIVLAALALRREGLSVWRYLLPVLIALMALIGARLFNYLLDPKAYGEDFPVWTLSYRKLSLMGGLIAGVLTVFAFCAAARKNPFRLLDAFVLPAGSGVILLKLGCFLNGCCCGKLTDGALGMVFPANAVLYDYLDTLPLFVGQNRAVYPTQLFELLGAALGLAVILPLCRRRTFPAGVKAVLYAMWFTLVRLAVHPLRAFPYDKRVITAAYPVFYCAMLLVLGITLTILIKKPKEEKPDVLYQMRISGR